MKRDLLRYGDWALVTGASKGLGEAFARRLAASGLNMVLVALESDLLDALALDLSKSHGVECRAVAADLATAEGLERLWNATDGIPVGVLVNNAGIGIGGEFASRDPGRLEALVRLNCLAPVLLTRHFLPGMLARDRGAVVMVGSVMSFISAPGETAYNASKAFDLHFGESLWGELRGTGIDVLALCPGGMRTGFFAAEGIRTNDVNRLHQFSVSPDRMAELALRNLGKKPVVSAWFAFFVSMLVRATPRRIVTSVTGWIIRTFVHYDAGETAQAPGRSQDGVYPQDSGHA